MYLARFLLYELLVVLFVIRESSVKMALCETVYFSVPPVVDEFRKLRQPYG